MTEQAHIGSIYMHGVTADNIKCTATHHDTFSCIKLEIGCTEINIICETIDVTAIRKILGGSNGL